MNHSVKVVRDDFLFAAMCVCGWVSPSVEYRSTAGDFAFLHLTSDGVTA